MNRIPRFPPAPDEVFYLSEDDTPLGETEAHILALMNLLLTLRQFYAQRPDHYVIGHMFLYWEKGNPEARKAPDVWRGPAGSLWLPSGAAASR